MALQIRVEGSRKIQTPTSSYYLYLVIVEFGTWSNMLEKRYSEFLELHRVMKLLKRVFNEPLPKFPGQKIWRMMLGGLNEEDVEDRMKRLDEYTKELARTVYARSSKNFAEFIGMPSGVRDKWCFNTLS
jgi:hypothetical protein